MGQGGTVQIGTLGRLIADSAGVRAELDRLTRQAASGRVASSFGGLGNAAPAVLHLRPAIAAQQGWQRNIDAATGRMAVTQTVLDRITAIASDSLSDLAKLNGINVAAIDTVAAGARAALREVAGLQNASVGGIYVFAGQDSANPPVPHPDAILTSGFYAQINAAVAGLGGAGAAATAAATLAVASSNASGTSPFSAFLSQTSAALQGQGASVAVGRERREVIGVLASTNGFVASSGGNSSGSYMRDVMRALATLGSLSSTQEGVPGFHDLVQDARDTLRGAIDAMAGDAGALGDTQTQLQAMRTGMAAVTTTLTGQIADAEDVDMAATLSRLSLVQGQLQSSYQMIAGMHALSLARFLSGG